MFFLLPLGIIRSSLGNHLQGALPFQLFSVNQSTNPL